jgi:hypothetical protein
MALVSLVFGLGCRSSSGPEPPTRTDAGGDVASSRDLGPAPDQSGAKPDGPSGTGAANGIGRPCSLAADAGAAQGVYNASASECPSHLCIKPVVQQNATSVVATTGATCSAECTQDSDCDGEVRDPGNPLDTRCAYGFACAVPFAVGSLCCKKLCMCKDFFSVAGGVTPTACDAAHANGAACAGTGGNPAVGEVTGVGEETDIYIRIKPTRQLDLVTMIDNSPGMAPKVAKLNAQFNKLIAALRDPADGTLPDLRVAIIDSDLGTGNAYASGQCGPKTLADGTVSPLGDLGRFQFPNSPTACTVNTGAQFLEYASGAAVSYSGDISTAFGCLTQNLGTYGCGEEHPLQAFEFALAARGVGNESQQAAFLRSNAYLGLLFLTDEDDCSAAPNDGMFGDKTELRTESASLRCATRGHLCGGRNLTDSPPGYPTSASFTHAFSDCAARTDTCPNMTDGWDHNTDTSGATDCSPLKNIARLAAEMKALKADPQYQILVAGIFGWPLAGADMASALYKIAPVPNPNMADTQHVTVYDYWPVCYDPDNMPTSGTTDTFTGFDTTAARLGATGGLREAAFIDEFGASGFKFSACERDYTANLRTFGTAISKAMQNLCLDYKLVDVDDATDGVQADCRVVLRMPGPDPNNPSRTIYLESPTALPQCPPGTTSSSVATSCWQLANDQALCPKSGQLVTVLRSSADISQKPQVDPGTMLMMQCRTCPSLAAGSPLPTGCDY